MTQSIATIPTAHASKYLQQLCKHFGHKVPVAFTPEAGEITLPFGTCALSASEDALTLTNAGEARDLPKLETVIADHLARFAFRENPTVTWVRST